MPDISMCRNEDCPSKKKCFRYMATPNPYGQYYSSFEVKKGRKKCDDFMKIENGRIR